MNQSDLSVSFFWLVLIQGLWIVFATFRLISRGDEIPLIASGFLAFFSSFRYWSVTSGRADWVNLGNFGFGDIQSQDALVALNYIVLGQSVLFATYFLAQRSKTVVLNPVPMAPQLEGWLRRKVFIFGVIAIPLVILVQGKMSQGFSQGQKVVQMSGYLYLFPMLLISVGIFIAVLWKLGAIKTVWHKLFAVFLIYRLISFTFGPTSRFMFIGWMLAGLIILTAGLNARKQAMWLGLGGVAIIALVSFAGSLRGLMDDAPVSSRDIVGERALKRTLSAEDANMLDGMVLIQRIYPQVLQYTWGMEHLETFTRPIPRSWWPEKPVGGYMNKLGITSITSGFTLGISPSIFGSFYQEGGVFGIVVLSIAYGLVIAAVVRLSVRVAPAAGMVLRGMLAASLIPLLRGGDLPGIYAWLGMAFWPCALIFWWKRREFGFIAPKTAPGEMVEF